MAKKFQDLLAQLSEERQQKIREGTQTLLAEMALQDLRKTRELSQEALAEALRVKQPGISKLEQRTDMHVSTLRRYVEALGGTLYISARFPDMDVPINLERIGNVPKSKRPRTRRSEAVVSIPKQNYLLTSL